MQLHHGSLYWPATTPPFVAEKINEPRSHYDAVIVGAGMSGALTAHYLMQQGLTVAVLDKRNAGEGSTSANTGLLQYSNDIMLSELIEQIGERDAVQFYTLCYEAMQDLAKVATPLACDFVPRNSIYYASSAEDEPRLRDNFAALTKHGFPVKESNFNGRYALITSGDAEINPLKFVQALLDDAEQHGVHVFPYTEVTDSFVSDNGVRLHTSMGDFTADAVIYTTGYETLPVGKRVRAAIHRSYVIVTEPLDAPPEAMMWETAIPYLYIRKTADNRLIIGGLDEDIATAPSEASIADHAEKLQQQAEQLLKRDLPIAYSYGATFGESVDNLPFIGAHPTKAHHYYLLGYGGNGTVYSMMGAKMLAQLVKGETPVGAHLVDLTERLV